MSKAFQYNKARTLILSDVLSFYITRDWGDRKTPSINGFTPADWSGGVQPQPGDLVILSSAPATKWTIGWLRAIDSNNGYTRYLIESLEDGEACWWSNVGLSLMPRDQIRERYRWSDKQFAFNARWMRLFKTANGAIRFNECAFTTGVVAGNAVTIGIRGYWDFADENPPPPITRQFDDYRKVTVAMLKSALAEMEADYGTREAKA